MSSKNATLAGIAVFIVFVFLIASVASKESTPSTLVGLSSTSNTSVKLYFSKPLSDSAGDPAAYKIYRPQSCDENNWHAELRVISAELSQDAKVVTLTTAAQSATRYQLVISGLSDKGGNLALPPEQDSITQFVGTTASQAVDTDGDGISDAEEQYGWAVWTTTASGISMCRDVNSDPDKKDTDGDGVEDGFEMSYATDPRSRDTDEDNLNDYIESYEYFSSPLTTDTDQDGISDGVEALLLNTSPVLSDTDGDGVDDSQEISSGGTDPRLADLPELRLDLHGNPSIILNMTISGETGITTVATTLQQDREEQVDTDNSATKMSIENTVKLHTEVKVGTSNWPPSANAKLTTDTKFKHGYFHETSSNWTDSSVAESKKEFEEKTFEKTVISYDDGMLWVAMKVTNNSNLTFKVKDLRVIAYRMLPNGSFSVVGTLTPGEKSSTVISTDPEITKDSWISQTLCADPADPSTCGHILGPGGEIVLVMGADSLPAQEMKALVTDPSALMFEIGSYSLYQLDEWGVTETVNFAKLGESVIQRTGILVIDYGDGRVERFMVATNTHRNPDGSGTGISLEEALKEIIGITDYELCEDQKTLCRLKNVSEFRCVYETSESEGMRDFCSPSPALSIVKTADPITYDAVGQVIQYSYSVTNTGNVKIREPITVSDDKADDENCPVVSSTGNGDEYLDPGESIACTASYSITQADLEAGAVTNVAYASGSDASDQPVTSPQDSVTIFLGTLVDTETISASQTADQATAESDFSPIPNGFWIVAGTGDQFDGNSNLGFNEIRLMDGERISLVYMQDSDGDGIYDREEYLLGTDKFNPDTDGDGLTDYFETKIGWTVSVKGQAPYQVFSDPRFPDFDEDFLTEYNEFALQSDPYLTNTDQDDLPDGIDPYPTTPPCMDPTFLSMSAWWDAGTSDTVENLMNDEPLGTIVGNVDDVSIEQNWRLKVQGFDNPGERVFRFNPGQTQRNQYITVEDNNITHSIIHADKELTVSAWINWQGAAAGSPQATILSKGSVESPTYSLSILADGRLQFSIFRNVHRNWFIYSDDINQPITVITDDKIYQNKWTHVTATFGGETMRIYIDGKQVIEKKINKYGILSATTNNLISNNNPLLIAVEKIDNPAWPFRGLMDDIQFYTRLLVPDEVEQVYNLGVCPPGSAE